MCRLVKTALEGSQRGEVDCSDSAVCLAESPPSGPTAFWSLRYHVHNRNALVVAQHAEEGSQRGTPGWRRGPRGEVDCSDSAVCPAESPPSGPTALWSLRYHVHTNGGRPTRRGGFSEGYTGLEEGAEG